MSVRISPSILAADFMNLERELGRITTADLVHVDVMDNNFVPNLTIGQPVVTQIAQIAPLPLDVHLMIQNPDHWAPKFAELIGPGRGGVTFHAEAAKDPVGTARTLRSLGVRAAIALRPGTQVEPYLEHLEDWDMILLMTVEPGFGGQAFQHETMPKLERTRAAIDASGLDIWLEVDGGIAPDTIQIARKAGADTFVAGSAVYGPGDAAARIAELRSAAEAVGR